MPKIRYDIRSGVQRTKSKLNLTKTLMLFVALALPVVLALSTLGASAAPPNWNVSGNWVFDYHYNGGENLHDMTLVQGSSGALTGSGGAFAGNQSYQYPWTIVNGTVNGDDINIYADYGNLACFFTLTGSIATDGTMSGTWTDDCDGNRNGTWATTSGAAQPIASSTVVVTGNTAAGENQPGWLFNRDLSTSTPYEFNTDAASIGTGSLFVKPISSTPSNKFIAENFIGAPVANLNSISYDFMQAGTTNSTSYKHFYMNVYANFPSSSHTKFYDCRYDYVPSSGGQTGWNTAVFSTNSIPTSVTTRGAPDPSPQPCPALLSDMTGGHVRMFAISVGDTSASDSGLAGYLDKVVVATNSTITTYDFEAAATNKEQCKNGGWMNYKDSSGNSFKNQGDCVSYVATKGKNKANG